MANQSRIYNAVYSSVQVFECMVRGIAVMRRRVDSYVNATQILKVAGIDKGRRTKILEKEILPGKHEIVQGGYGKYQGTWIPLERGRDVAAQYGVAPLLAPLFDHVPSSAGSLGTIPPTRPPSTSYTQHMPQLAPTPIYPSSPSVLFNPSTSYQQAQRQQHIQLTQQKQAFTHGRESAPPTLKRAHEEIEELQDVDMQMLDLSRPHSQPNIPVLIEESSSINGNCPPSPSKRARTQTPLADGSNGVYDPDELVARFATRPPMYRTADKIAALKNPKRSSILSSMYQQHDPHSIVEMLLNQDLPQPDVDLILDDQGHTALHLAASLAKHACADLLVAHGADIHRGNFAGETPLIRAVLSTNNYDLQSFHSLVSLLHGSIRTLDGSRRSVLHHIVHIAAVKGRAASARYYLECVLMWVAKHQGGDFRSIVDLQDEHGDTALNIAARIGNRSLVKTLVDVGANRILPNKLGLRPGDFGVEGEDLWQTPRAEDLISALRTGPALPTHKSQDLVAEMTSIIKNLNDDFQAELKSKQEALNITQAHLRAATRELADQRRQIQTWQDHCNELDQVHQRVRNISKALKEEDRFDWTGRTELDGQPASTEAGLAFLYRGHGSTLAALGVGATIEVSFNVDIDPAIPTADSSRDLVRMKRLSMWHKRIETLMKKRLEALQGLSADKEFMCKKVVSLCTGVPLDQVEGMLENLLIAVESEAQVVDLGRVAGFMQKVRDGDA